MSQGLFELRKDAITGWWVATVVDRTFARERFAAPALSVDDHGDCFNCRMPAGDGIRLRTLKVTRGPGHASRSAASAVGPASQRVTASGCGSSRTSRSTWSGPRRRRERGSSRSPA